MHATLPQRLFLLCYTVEKEKFELTNLQGRGQLLRAGALAELTLDGRLHPEGGKGFRRPDAEPPEDSFLAEVWHDVPTDKPKGWLSLVHGKAHTSEKPVRLQLAATGAVTIQHDKWMKMLAVDRVAVTDPERVRAEQKTVREAVFGGPDPAAVPMAELTMAVLAAEVEVTSVFTGKERAEHKRTLKVLAARFDDAVPGLRKALRDSYLSSRAVGGGWGT
ncbi:GPP34 family phosphoprotein [Streptomyces sp. NPDC048172]|uniref:GOLPH3/VPS74 family protein n=1 Tax=Streptomyces sp. NPDC048172 TaxID=3365505 RepID=UPI003712DBC5